MKVTIDELREANVASDMWITANDDGRSEMQTELDIEMYESIYLDGTFVVEREVKDDGQTVNLVTLKPWTFLQRRILVNSIKLAGLHEEHKWFKVNSIVAYEFRKGVHVTGIADDRIQSAVIYIDYENYTEPKPLYITVYLK
jgi:hypothetical protein